MEDRSVDLRNLRSSKGGSYAGTARRRAESEQAQNRRTESARQGQSALIGGASAGGWHKEGVPIESIRAGDRMPGIVTNAAPFGTFVDVGAVRNAKLILDPQLCRRFQVGDRLDCVVKEVEMEKRRFCVTLLNAEAELAENRMRLEELAEGDMVDGIIHHTNPHGIWVNVGADVIGRLNVPRRFTNHLVPGQCIRDIIIQRVDLQEVKLGLTLKEPEVLMRETVMISDLLRSDSQAEKKSQVPPVPQVPVPPPAPPAPRAASRSQSVPPAPVVPVARTREAKEQVQKRENRTATPPREAVAVAPPSGTAGLRVGQFIDGIVVDVSSRVVMVDIGLGHLAALAVSPSIRAQLQREDEVQGMRVERVDWDEERKKGAVVLSLDDPELIGGSPTSSARSQRWDEGWQQWQPSWSWSSWNWDKSWDWRNDRGWYQADSWWR